MAKMARRGRAAETPSQMGVGDWKDILWRVRGEVAADRITLIAAGATYYLLLALFPALAAFVSLYGFVADPVTVADHIAFLGGVLPSGGVDLIRTQLQSLAAQNDATLSVGMVFGILVALWSANSGVKTLFEALNVAYEEEEKRSFIRLNLISLAFTLGAIVIGILFIVMVGVVPAVLAFVGLSGAQEVLIAVLRWPALLIVSAFAISLLYRYGPSREKPKWRWVTWGSVIAAAVWLAASILFSWYLANFADYNATYGSLGAVIGFMLWTWISIVILLLGAELNAELEHQTARDSTTGAPRPMGTRGARMADTLGAAYGDAAAQGDAGAAVLDPGADPLRRGDAVATSRRQPASPWLVPVLALAVPAGAFGVGLILAALDPTRRRPRRNAAPRAGAPQRQPRHLNARPVQPPSAPRTLWDRARAHLDDPALRAQVAQVARAAAALAQATERRTRR
jgi:membrane protein